MRSFVVSRGELCARGAGFLMRLRRDRVFAEAAEASFYLMTSLVPFLSLLFAFTGLFLPEDPRTLPLPEGLSARVGETVLGFADEIAKRPGIPLLSVQAVLALWSASRGIASVRASLAGIYDAPEGEGALIGRLRAIPSTLAVTAAMTAPTLFSLFGDMLAGITGGRGAVLIRALGTPLLFALLAAVFTLFYCAAGRRSPILSGRVGVHLPGALFSASGWFLFSALTRCLGCFPGSPLLYGTLGAVTLFMLRLYFCTVIVLLGAEVNRTRQERESSARKG
ncbi:MAG: YihY/virulence factor BrkB family protein [Clostridia bacterium]|nr:YihY/virulence factor BrkB family protein [Clostridia bacterium]